MTTALRHEQNLRVIRHEGRRILEIIFTERSVLESQSIIYEYAFLLSMLKAGEKARVLVDLNGAVYDQRLFAAWSARVTLFEGRVEKSAIIGASHLGVSGVQRFSLSASRLNLALGPERGVIFGRREDALDWLAMDPRP